MGPLLSPINSFSALLLSLVFLLIVDYFYRLTNWPSIRLWGRLWLHRSCRQTLAFLHVIKNALCFQPLRVFSCMIINAHQDMGNSIYFREILSNQKTQLKKHKRKERWRVKTHGTRSVAVTTDNVRVCAVYWGIFLFQMTGIVTLGVLVSKSFASVLANEHLRCWICRASGVL